MAKPGLVNNVKFKHLVHLLKMPAPHIHGHLDYLWRVAYDSEKFTFNSVEIEIAAEWRGDADVFTNALIKTRFLDEIDDDLYEIHDHKDHEPEWYHSRVRKRNYREKKRKDREEQEDCPGTGTGQERDSPGQVRSRNGIRKGKEGQGKEGQGKETDYVAVATPKKLEISDEARKAVEYYMSIKYYPDRQDYSGQAVRDTAVRSCQKLIDQIGLDSLRNILRRAHREIPEWIDAGKMKQPFHVTNFFGKAAKWCAFDGTPDNGNGNGNGIGSNPKFPLGKPNPIHKFKTKKSERLISQDQYGTWYDGYDPIPEKPDENS